MNDVLLGAVVLLCIAGGLWGLWYVGILRKNNARQGVMVILVVLGLALLIFRGVMMSQLS